MKGSRRTYLTAGIALTTASVIAVSPVAPPAQAVPDIRTASPTVQLAARPYDAYFEIFEPLAATPIIDQLNANADLLDEALASGVPADEAIEQFVEGPAEQFAVYLEVAARQLPRVPGVALTGSVLSTMTETGWILFNLLAAARALDGREVAYVLAEAPARLVSAALWGSGPTGGLLTWPRNVRENLARALIPRPWVPVPAEITDTSDVLVSAAGQSTASLADQLSDSTLNLFARVFEAYVGAAENTAADHQALIDRVTENLAPVREQFLASLENPGQLGRGLFEAAVVLEPADTPVTTPFPLPTPHPAVTVTVEVAQKVAPPAKDLPAETPTNEQEEAPNVDEAAATEAVVKETDSLEKDLEKPIDAAKERDSLKPEKSKDDERPGKSDRAKPFKKIRDSIRATVADIREQAKSAADRHDGKRADKSNSTKKSKDDSAPTSNEGSDSGSGTDDD